MNSTLLSKKVFKLNSGYSIPAVGLGTYQVRNQDEIDEAVSSAWEAGYRHIDTAVFYRNEKMIANALEKYKIPREEMFLTTKVPSDAMTYKDAKKCIEKSLKDLGTSYIDLFLIHWPGAKSVEDRLGVWRALEESVENGSVRSIGVSNFLRKHLKTILDNCKIKPAVNQIELHPLYIDSDTITYCNENDIVIEAYSPFARFDDKLIRNESLLEVAKKYKKKPNQVLVRWCIQHGWVVLPKSVKKNRVIENIDIDDFELSEEDIKILDSLNCGYKVCWDPNNVKF
jgi:diketogulonate reductase-like aldo/keto reductase